ncbi:MAG: hypothetical protein RMY64_25640 [Nostoc sp. DedQUE08]|uniref:hypothetical protein n=1 Tax=Nostoc sp. DedQUE08 TaxID=3075393 RepID=UPI002AD3CB28|nr:hypothetical protein [Nostoc sp. DedQUE08]MDZ8068978.1 hypothetical protein [Nostoc sp. DedQUE08]
MDVFFIEYVSPTDDIAQVQMLLDELYSWKDKGLVRYVGVTTHNRRIQRLLVVIAIRRLLCEHRNFLFSFHQCF